MQQLEEYPRAPYLKQEVMAYHGTSRTNALAILRAREIRVSERSNDWLGRGAYFFEGSAHRAREWARDHREEPTVIQARVRLGHCIDLADNRWKYAVREAEAELQREAISQGGPPISNKGKNHILDCAVVNRLAHMWRPDTIRAAFGEDGPLAPGSTILENTHIQIAIRQPKQAILEYRIDGGWP